MDYKDLGIPYTRDQLLKIVHKQMSDKRFEHVKRVEATALMISQDYDINKSLVSIAALLHDYGKERPDSDYLQLMDTNPWYQGLKPYGNNIWHGVLGALLVKKELHIENEDILRAMQVHTIGSTEMSLLDKIIYLADYIEPAREFPGVDDVRKIVFAGKLDQAILMSLKNTITFLVHKEQIIFPYTVDVYNHFVQKIKE